MGSAWNLRGKETRQGGRHDGTPQHFCDAVSEQRFPRTGTSSFQDSVACVHRDPRTRGTEGIFQVASDRSEESHHLRHIRPDILVMSWSPAPNIRSRAMAVSHTLPEI